jgi:hypothetical protein
MTQGLRKVPSKKIVTKKFSTTFLSIQDKNKSKFQNPVASTKEDDNYRHVKYNTALAECDIQPDLKKL